jgi:regulatory protein
MRPTRPRRTDPASAVEADLRARALRLLARREHSRAELRRKLAAHADDGDDLEALLDDFTRRGWLSEERFVEQAVRARAQRHGPLRIAHHLREKGIGEEAIARAVADARAGQHEALAAAWRSRFGRLPADQAEKARQVRFLQGRGFPVEAVLRFLREAGGR